MVSPTCPVISLQALARRLPIRYFWDSFPAKLTRLLADVLVREYIIYAMTDDGMCFNSSRSAQLAQVTKYLLQPRSDVLLPRALGLSQNYHGVNAKRFLNSLLCGESTNIH